MSAQDSDSLIDDLAESIRSGTALLWSMQHLVDGVTLDAIWQNCRDAAAMRLLLEAVGIDVYGSYPDEYRCRPIMPDCETAECQMCCEKIRQKVPSLMMNDVLKASYRE